MKSQRTPTLAWHGDVASGYLELLDQRKLPGEIVVWKIDGVEELWDAIRTLAVRGAPAIGVAAAYGMVLAARSIPGTSQAAQVIKLLAEKGEYLKSSRPTAVNLEWAVSRMLNTAIAHRGVGVRPLQKRLLAEARAIHAEDREMCEAIGKHGAKFIRNGMGVLTHCNAGALATSDHGTALAIMYEAQKRSVRFEVFADETRPLLQGARLTAWELQRAGIDVTLICDSMAAMLMSQKKIGLIVVGADRIAANGDTANKIGTYSLACLAKAHKVPFVVAAPSSSFDLNIGSGSEIPIELRSPDEITHSNGKRVAPEGVKVYNPAFDVTPAELIAAIVTEKGVVDPVNEKKIRAMVEG
jgi:methylthioribose-1-phosphate isomerase